MIWYTRCDKYAIKKFEGEEDINYEEVVPSEEPSVEEQAVTRCLCEHINIVMDGNLKKETCEILRYRFICGMTCNQVASAVGLPKEKVYARTHYGLQKVRDMLGVKKQKSKAKESKQTMEISVE